MTIIEVIDKLAEIYAEYGNVDCFLCNDYWGDPELVVSVEYQGEKVEIT